MKFLGLPEGSPEEQEACKRGAANTKDTEDRHEEMIWLECCYNRMCIWESIRIATMKKLGIDNYHLCTMYNWDGSKPKRGLF